jgi:hypothetical protein
MKRFISPGHTTELEEEFCNCRYPANIFCKAFVIQKLGAYTVRYLFVIYRFSLAETQNLEVAFLLDEPMKRSIWNHFDIGFKT